MHRLRSKSAIYRFRFAALLWIAMCILAPVAAGLLWYALIIHHQKLTQLAASLIVLIPILIVVQWLAATKTNCPLCMTPVLAKKRCSKHRNARALLGSHRLRVSLSIFTRNSFRCPYCHEPTALEVRGRDRQ